MPEYKIQLLDYQEAIKRAYLETSNDPILSEGTRSPFASDRMRIIGSNCFRRLSIVTQVLSIYILVNSIFPRTRIIHSLELSEHVERSALAIGLDIDAARAIMMGHDIGHTLFGHAGTLAINKILREQFKYQDKELFNHEAQGYRIVTILESFSHDYRGLNLTSLIRNSFYNRTKRGIIEINPGTIEPFPEGFLSLEEQLVEVIDKFFVYHDTEDMLELGLYSIDELSGLDIPILSKFCLETIKQDRKCPKEIARKIFNKLYRGLINNIVECEIPQLIKKYPGQFILTNPAIIGFDSELQKEFDGFKKWLYANVYSNNPLISDRDEKSYRTIKLIFDFLYAEGNESKQIARIYKFNQGRFRLNLLTPHDVIQSIIDLLTTSSELYATRFCQNSIIFC